MFGIPRRHLTGLVAASVLIVGGASPVVAEPPLQGDCSTAPEVMAVDDLQPGMTGVGFTVVEGREPAAFDVEVLGVIPNGIGLGLDFILVKTSGELIETTGGIASGFSGSPVYINGKLVGAVAYGFAGADQSIGGVTPAEAMMEILDYPDRAAQVFDAQVTLDSALQEIAAEAAGVATASFPATARALPIPLGVTGVGQRALDMLQERFDDQGIAVQPYLAGGSTEAVEGAAILPGESLSAALSYGDFQSFATGTATLCRDESVVAFGHPFFHSGRSELGMNAADVITVVPDPSGLFGGFKIATIAETVGTIDRDHRAGVRGVNGLMPSTTPVTSSVSGPELDRTRQGQSDVVYDDWLDTAAGFHLLANIDVVFDQIGEGSSTVAWTVGGERADGTPFELTRDNRYYSEYDIAFESIFELMNQVRAIHNNPFEEVTITRIDVPAAEVVSEKVTAAVTKVLVATTSDPELRERDEILVDPGDTIFAVTHLQPADGSEERAVGMAITVPEGTEGAFGSLNVHGGSSQFFGEFAEFDGGVDGNAPASFDELLVSLEDADRNSDLIAHLGLFVYEEIDRPANGGEGGTTTIREVRPQAEVITGAVFMNVTVGGSIVAPEGAFLPAEPRPVPQPPIQR